MSLGYSLRLDAFRVTEQPTSSSTPGASLWASPRLTVYPRVSRDHVEPGPVGAEDVAARAVVALPVAVDHVGSDQHADDCDERRILYDLATGLEVALEGGVRRIDVGAADDRYFAVMAGMGFDARLLEAASDTAKATGTRSRFGSDSADLGSPAVTRTRNLPVNSRLLCQLSYGGSLSRRGISVPGDWTRVQDR